MQTQIRHTGWGKKAKKNKRTGTSIWDTKVRVINSLNIDLYLNLVDKQKFLAGFRPLLTNATKYYILQFLLKNRTVIEPDMVSVESTKGIVYLCVPHDTTKIRPATIIKSNCVPHDTTKIRPATVIKSKSSVGIVFGVVASILVVGAIGFLLFKKWKSGKNSKQPVGHNNQNFQIE